MMRPAPSGSARLAAPLASLAQAPAIGATVEVAPGILWLRLALPFALDHVNVWLCDDGDTWTVIDTGVGDERTREVWQGLLAGSLAGKPVARVIATHFHPDHIGSAGWLCGLTGADLAASRTEWLATQWLVRDDSQEFIAAGRRHDSRAGLAADLVQQRAERGNRYRQIVGPPPGSFSCLAAGDEMRLAGGQWRVIIGRGHSPEQVMLYSSERRLLIAADQVLPRISPNIGVWAAEPEADPLGDFLTSNHALRDLPEDTTVLPSHDWPFQGLYARLRSLQAHHEERLSRALDACAEPTTAAAVMQQLFTRPLDMHQTGFAVAETLAHLNRLIATGWLERRMSHDGAWLYARR